MLYTDEQARDLIKKTREQYPASDLMTHGARMTQLMAALSERLPKKTKTVRPLAYTTKDGSSGEVTLSEASIGANVQNCVNRGDTYIAVYAPFTVTDDE